MNFYGKIRANVRNLQGGINNGQFFFFFFDKRSSVSRFIVEIRLQHVVKRTI